MGNYQHLNKYAKIQKEEEKINDNNDNEPSLV
jgi:hypothetical protein